MIEHSWTPVTSRASATSRVRRTRPAPGWRPLLCVCLVGVLVGSLAACPPGGARAPGGAMGPAGFPTPRASERGVGTAPRPGTWSAPAVPARPVRVLFRSPVTRAQGKATVQVMFNQPMVRLGRVKSQREDPARYPIEIVPPVRAVYRWVTGDTLKVALTRPLRDATRYRVRLLPSLRSLAGTRLAGPVSWSFETPRPRVTSIGPKAAQPVVAGHIHPRDYFELRFNLPVRPVAVARVLRVRTTGSGGRGVRVAVRGAPKDSHVIRVVPRAPLPEGATVSVAVERGLRSVVGDLPSDERETATFQVRGRLSASLTCDRQGVAWGKGVPRVRCWPMRNGLGYQGLEITFSEPVTRTALLAHLRVTPPIRGLAKRLESVRADCRIQGRPKTACSTRWAVSGSLSPSTRYRVWVTPGLRDVWGQRLPGAPAARFATRSFPPGLHLPAGGEVFREAWHPWHFIAVNAPDVRARLARFRGGALARFLGCRRYGRRGKVRWPDRCLRGRSLVTRTWRLAGSRDRLVDKRPTLSLGMSLLRLDSPQVVGPAGEQVPFDRMVIRTDLGLHARMSAYGVTAWVTSLRSGRPVRGARVAVYEMDGARAGKEWGSGRTDADGLARLRGQGLRKRLQQKGRPRLLVAARLGKDEAYVTPLDGRWYGRDENGWYGRWMSERGRRASPWVGDTPQLVAHVSTERGIYRPGHRVYVHGAVRRFVAWKGAPASGLTLQVRIDDSSGQVVARGQVKTNGWGVFVLHLDLPRVCPLGKYTVRVHRKKELLALYGFRVAEYRPPRFVARVRLAPKVLVGDGAIGVRLRGRYLFGGPMGGAGYRLSIRRTLSQRTWKRWKGYFAGAYGWSLGLGGGVWHRASGTLDGRGRAALSVSTRTAKRPHNPWPTWHQAELEVWSAARRTASARHGVEQIPGSRLVAVKRLDAKKNALRFRLRVVDPKGRPSGARAVRAALVAVAPNQGYSWRPKVVWDRVVWHRTMAVGRGGATLAVRWPKGYAPRRAVLLLRVTDAKGREARTALRVERPSRWTLEREREARRERARKAALTLTLDKEAYLPGETALATVSRARGVRSAVLLVERERIFFAKRLRFDARGRVVVRIPVLRAYASQVTVRAVGVRAGKALRGDMGPTAEVEKTLSVKPDPFLLDVALRTDRKRYHPGERVRVSVAVRDWLKRPRQSGVVLMAVDEAVLNLTGFRLPNPYYDLAYTPPDAVLSDDVRAHLARLGIRVVHQDYTEARALGGMGGGGVGSGGGGGGLGVGGISSHRSQRPRRTFKTTAWHTTLVTDAAGRATASFTLPDNLTRYRIMAFAVDRDRSAGTGATRLEVSLPLLSLPALPRFLREGDRARAGVVLYNTGLPSGRATVRVGVRGGAVAVQGPTTLRVMLGKGAAKEVRFGLRAVRKGTAHFSFEVEAGGRTDRLEWSLRVTRPVVPEAASVAGETHGAVRHGLERLAGLRSDVGGLEVSLASTALTGVEDGMDQLIHYPYGCLEQTASRLLPLLAVAVLGKRFSLPLPRNPKPLIRAGIAKVLSMQNSDGGFGYWPESRVSWLWTTAYALIVLHRAARAARVTGVPLDRRAVRRGIRYLEEQGRRWRRLGRYWFTYEAFLIYALAQHGRDVTRRALALFRERRHRPLFARALLLETLARARRKTAATRRAVAALVNEMGDSLKLDGTTAHAEEGLHAGYQLFMHSDDRTTAMVLLALLHARPAHPLVTKLLRWFLQGRKQARFRNTQEAAWALLAFWDFAVIRERTVPDFEAGVWLGGARVLRARFRGRSVHPVLKRIPMAALQRIAGQAARDLVVAKRGAGTLYYVARLRYARRELPRRPRDHGFAVRRTVQVLDRAGRPLRRQRPPGLGDTVLVTLRVRSTEARRYVAIDDPLPAGLEAIDTRLATASREGTQALDWRTQSRYDHRELRDDRVLFFRDTVQPGTLTYRYLARVTTPGRFLAPPTQAKQMYVPEVFGYTASRWVRY